ncbi:SCO6880 family protein [Nesterenkonia sp.]|uniref:SCO6880 family protein n=1 Tax=Nesterenkonia sp. TaxID=704201 RepID=UPI002613C7C2|nr:SCO6880 family protein [Nesterenkonia sp.]
MSQDVEVLKGMFGNLTLPKRSGILGLSMGASLVLVPCFLLSIGFLATQRLLTAVAAIAVPLVLLALAPITRAADPSGRSIYRRLMIRFMQRRKEKSGQALYLSGASGHTPDGTTRLPGLLARAELTEHVGSHDLQFGMIRLSGRGSHLYTVVLEAFPDGDALIDEDRLRRYVDHWGAWLSDRSLDENVKAASVVVESAPDTGMRLNRLLTSKRAEGAPEFSTAVTEAIAEEYSAGSPQVTVKVTVTFDGRDLGTGKDRGTAEMAEEIGARLPAIVGGLTTTGAGRVEVCTAQEIVDSTYLAYDPHAQVAMEEDKLNNGGTGLSWEDVGPTFHYDALDRYAHQRAISASWTLFDKPEGFFGPRSLQRALDPISGVMRKRVTLLYRPIPRSQTAAEAERELKNSRFAGSQARDDQRAKNRRDAALKTQQEEARGAGMTRFGMIVTVTLDGEDPEHAHDELRRLRRQIPQSFSDTRLRLREALGNEAVTFQAGLPLGLVLPEHMLLPEDFRRWF